jgi:hypothetical protein
MLSVGMASGPFTRDMQKNSEDVNQLTLQPAWT